MFILDHDFQLPKEAEGPSSPSSQDLADYEVYARTELPRLVEATLEALIQAETEPLEEKLKPLLVGIVRDCQSTLGRRWSLIKDTRSASASSSVSIQHRASGDPIGPQGCQSSSMQTGITETRGPLQDIIATSTIVEASYQEPPLLGPEESSTTAEAFEKSHNASKQSIGHQVASDSGYGTLLSEYLCLCDQLCDQLLDFSSHTITTEQAHFPAAEPGAALDLPMSSVPGLRENHSASMTDLRSEDQGHCRCDICGGLLPLPS
jgi:hypothetical protein